MQAARWRAASTRKARERRGWCREATLAWVPSPGARVGRGAGLRAGGVGFGQERWRVSGNAGRDACATVWRAGWSGGGGARRCACGRAGACRQAGAARLAGPGVAPASVPARSGEGWGAGGVGERRQGRLRHGLACRLEWGEGRGDALAAGPALVARPERRGWRDRAWRRPPCRRGWIRAGALAGIGDRRQGRLRHGLACRRRVGAVRARGPTLSQAWERSWGRELYAAFRSRSGSRLCCSGKLAPEGR